MGLAPGSLGRMIVCFYAHVTHIEDLGVRVKVRASL